MRLIDVLRRSSPRFEDAARIAAARLIEQGADEGPVTEAASMLAEGALRTEPGHRAADASLLALPGAALEAIILAELRPAWFIDNDRIVIDGPFEGQERVTDNLAALEAAARRVGRVDLVHHGRLDYAGTGWLVAPDIAVTNRHVARVFAEAGRPGGWSFAAGRFAERMEARLTPDRQRRMDAITPRQAEVAEILWIAPDAAPDIAFLRVRPGHGIEPMTPADRAAQQGEGIAAIGYPAWDGTRNSPGVMHDIFGGVYDVKRFSPGEVIGLVGQRRLLADYSSLGGNSGSAVVSLEDARVVGLHFAGLFGEANHAVPISVVQAALRDVEGQTVAVGRPPVAATAAGPGDDLGDRAGYDPEFLGPGALRVALPSVVAWSGDLAPVNGAPDDPELRYTHFSVIQSRSRRMPLVTAVNIDGAKTIMTKRRDRWSIDGRLDPAHQLDNRAYADNPLDKGHMVRRKDPGWGDTPAEAEQGESDSFYYTNAVPQHRDLNRRDWSRLEDYILEAVDTRDFRACVMTGPILREDDPVLPLAGDRVAIPQGFWKVAAMVRADTGVLSVTAYVLDQGEMIADLTEAAFVFGEFRTYQVPLRMVETATRLDFGSLRDHDPLGGLEEAPFGEGASRIDGPDSLRL